MNRPHSVVWMRRFSKPNLLLRAWHHFRSTTEALKPEVTLQRKFGLFLCYGHRIQSVPETGCELSNTGARAKGCACCIEHMSGMDLEWVHWSGPKKIYGNSCFNLTRAVIEVIHNRLDLLATSFNVTMITVFLLAKKIPTGKFDKTIFCTEYAKQYETIWSVSVYPIQRNGISPYENRWWWYVSTYWKHL